MRIFLTTAMMSVMVGQLLRMGQKVLSDDSVFPPPFLKFKYTHESEAAVGIDINRTAVSREVVDSNSILPVTIKEPIDILVGQ